MEQEKNLQEPKPNGYRVLYDAEDNLPDLVAGLLEIAQEKQYSCNINYHKPVVLKFVAVKYDSGIHEQDLEQRISKLPNVTGIDRDYLRRMIE